jgi:hypothetical protein
VDPEDRVDGCGRLLFGKLVVAFMRAHHVECKERREEKKVCEPAHSEVGLESERVGAITYDKPTAVACSGLSSAPARLIVAPRRS